MRTSDPLKRNIVLLMCVKVSGFLLPLVTLPFLARVLGPREFGELSVAQSLALLLSVLVEYGFLLSATREIASSRDDDDRAAEIVREVNSARLGLALTAGILAIGAHFLLGNPPAWPLLLGAWLYAIAVSVSPSWYFQGTERVPGFAEIDMGGKAISVTLVFLLVQTPDDGKWALIVLALGPLAATTMSVQLMYRRVLARPLRLAAGMRGIRSGVSMFAFRAAISLYTLANVLILSFYLPPTAVGFFAAAERLVRGGAGLIGPVSQAMFPRIAYLVRVDIRAGALLVRRALVVLASTSFLAAAFTSIFAKEVTRLFFGNGYEPAAELLRLLIWIAPLIAIGNVLGIQWMLSLKLDRPFNLAVIGAGAFNLIGAIIFASTMGTTGMAYVCVATEAFVVVCLVWTLVASGKWPTTRESRG